MGLLRNISNWYFSKRALPYWCILILDCAIVLATGYIAFYILHGGDSFARNFWALTRGLVVVEVIFLVYFRLMHTYTGVLRYSSFVDLQRVSIAMFSASATVAVVELLCRVAFPHNRWIIILDWRALVIMFSVGTLLLWIVRVLVKTLYDVVRSDRYTERVFIYGVHEGGIGLAKSMRNESPIAHNPVGFVSPDGEMTGLWLLGVPVYADDDSLVETMKSKGVKCLFISPLQTQHFRTRDTLIDALLQENIRIMMMPDAEQWDGKSDLGRRQLHEVDIEDLLPREKIEVDMESIGAMLKDKSILITGAAGSIGSEMVRQVAQFGPSRLLLIDQAETPMHDIRMMMASQWPDIECATVVCSITKEKRMEALVSEFKPDYVFHAAAYKHVPMMEDNPSEAIQNNIRGTRVMADLAVKYGVKKFVMISTDKAVNPTNVMGCSKRICEIYCQSLGNAIKEGKVEGVTQFVTTRFGNVLGSNGSVIPIFKDQIAKGGPVTVTDPDIVRYFMLIPEACRLVLEAGTMGKGGEIFVFDMGKPVKIVDLARRMIRLSGAQDMEIKFTGLRDGEKLYEEVLSTAENTHPTPHPKIRVATVREYDYATACANEDRLLESSYTFDDMEMVRVMKEIVPEYKSKHSKYEILDIK